MDKNTPKFDNEFKMADFLLGFAHGPKRLFLCLGMLHAPIKFLHLGETYHEGYFVEIL